MEKMRGATTYILWVLILSFGLLWMLADTKVFDSMMRGPRSAGEVNGEKISLQEYQQRVQYYVQQHNRQNKGQMTAERRAYYEQQAWNEIVATRLMTQKMKKMGLRVTNAELVQMITGENPDPLIKKQFQRKDGTINRAALRKAIESEKLTQKWIMIEERLRQKRRQQKMSTYIRSALEVSNYEIKEAYTEANSYADIAFVRFPYADIPKDKVNVSDEQMRTYYRKNKDQFKRKKTFDFKYVRFDKTPTKQDTMRTIKELRGLRTEFAKADQDSAFLARYQTDASYQSTQVKKSEIREEFRPIIDLKKGEVTQVIKADDKYHILKKLNETPTEVEFIRLTYEVDADPIATIEKAHENADDFSYYAEQSSFEKEAKRRNKKIKSSSATKGNNFIPGIGQSRQIMQFLEPASEGELSRPIELDNQFVVIKVTDVKPAGPRPFDQVKDQIKTRVLNKQRQQRMMDKVKELRASNKSLEKMAREAGRKVQTATDLTLNASTIPGAGREPKVVGSIFGMKESELSSPLAGNNAVFVIQLKSKEMAKPNQISSSIKQKLAQKLNRKKTQTYMQVWMEELKDNAEIVDYRDQVLQ